MYLLPQYVLPQSTDLIVHPGAFGILRVVVADPGTCGDGQRRPLTAFWCSRARLLDPHG